MGKSKDCIDNKTDIAVLKVEHTSVKEFIKSMEANHLPHIYNRLNSIEKNIAYWGGGIAVFIVIAQLITQILLP